MPTNKQKGYEWEKIVAEYYKKNGCTILKQNFTIKGGEIDIIAQKDDTLYFVEVKVVNYMEEMDNYITPAKLKSLKRTIATYQARNNCYDLLLQIDVVFVKQGRIIERFKNITNS